MWKIFPRERTYLDIAAGISGNPSSPHAEGRTEREKLEHARTRIARLIESKADDVIFTGGATEANALAILGTVRTYQRMYGRTYVLYAPGAHASIVENVKLAEAEGAVTEPLPIKDCQVDCQALATMLRGETALITMEAVCGETGVVWNTREIARVLEKSGHPMSTFWPRLHVDASQAAWTQVLKRAHFGADLLTLDSSKVCEARGIGCLVAPRTIALTPLYGGGGQERGLVPGSEAPALAAAFAEGLERAAASREAFHIHALSMRAKLVERIRAGIPGMLVNESTVNQDPHILNISLLAPTSPGSDGTPRDTDYLVALLDEAGFAVSTKSACESDSGAGSRAVLALYGGPERAASTLRVSWGPTTHELDLSRFATALIRAVAFIDSSKAP